MLSERASCLLFGSGRSGVSDRANRRKRHFAILAEKLLKRRELNAGDVEVVAGFELDVDAVFTLGSLPGAIGGVLDAAGLARFKGTPTTTLILVRREEAAGGMTVAAAE